MSHKKVVIIGAGPAGLMAAFTLSKQPNVSVEVFDASKAVARKFLVAGHGGFNLTHSENLVDFVQKYSHPFISDAVLEFTPDDTIQFLSDIGIETYTGSSGKIFPVKSIKPIQVLNNWLDALAKKSVSIHTAHKCINFDKHNVVFEHNDVTIEVNYDYLIFALGGASWSVTGSKGDWLPLFSSKGIEVAPFQASNAGIELANWNTDLQGGVLKNTAITIGNQTRFGEIELTAYGLEGAPVYSLNKEVRNGTEELYLNLKPTFSLEYLQQLHQSFKGSHTDFLRSIKLSKPAINLMKSVLSKDDFMDSEQLVQAIVNLPLSIHKLRPIEEAISTVGGITMESITPFFELKQFPTVFCIGEMLDWDAPTGGYLLQASFSTGVKTAQKINQYEEG